MRVTNHPDYQNSVTAVTGKFKIKDWEWTSLLVKVYNKAFKASAGSQRRAKTAGSATLKVLYTEHMKVWKAFNYLTQHSGATDVGLQVAAIKSNSICTECQQFFTIESQHNICSACFTKDKVRLQKLRYTRASAVRIEKNLAKYGAKTVIYADTVDKRRASNMIVHGGPAPTCNPLVLAKRAANNLAKWDNLAATFGYLFDPNLTEWENCAALGIHRIFDAGKIKWILTLV